MSISSVSSSMAGQMMQQMRGMGGKPPSKEEMFNEIDSDGSGGVSQSEFAKLAEKISSKSGTSSDVEEALSSYDTDGDGELNSEELDAFMVDNRPPMPERPDMAAFMEEEGEFPGPSFDMAQAISAYGSSDSNQQQTLLSMFGTDA